VYAVRALPFSPSHPTSLCCCFSSSFVPLHHERASRNKGPKGEVEEDEEAELYFLFDMARVLPLNIEPGETARYALLRPLQLLLLLLLYFILDFYWGLFIFV
jgi:hypothetical protein